jgi:hypothetical protein
MKLQELLDAKQRLDELMEQNGGEITPEVEPLLEAVATIDERVQWLADLIDQDNTEAARLKKLEQEVSARRKAAENRAERRSNYLLYVMKVAGVDRSNGVRDVKLAKKAPHLGVVQDEKLPDIYFNYSQTFELHPNDLAVLHELGYEPQKLTAKVDRKRLLDDLKNGAEVPGAELITDGKRLAIK